MKWVVFLSLFLTFFKGFSEQEVYGDFQSAFSIYALESTPDAGGILQDTDFPCVPRIYEHIESENEESDDHHDFF